MEKYIASYRRALCHLMRQNKLTQANLAEKTGLSQAQISRMLKHPRYIGSEEARRRIALALSTSYEQMLELGFSLLGREVTGKAQDMKVLPNILFTDISVDANYLIEKIIYIDTHDPQALRLLRPLLKSLCDDITRQNELK